MNATQALSSEGAWDSHETLLDGQERTQHGLIAPNSQVGLVIAW
ncbi:MAG: hypothetical protein AAF493_13605 [Pseudomonadota bacterium]